MKIPIFIVATLFYDALADTFIYPNAFTSMIFRVGDTVNVSWVSSYMQPELKLFCGYQETRTSSLLTQCTRS